MEHLFTFRLLILWVHILGVILWIGGSLFIPLVIIPALRETLSLSERFRIMERVGRRFLPISWGLLLLILFTGLINVMNTGIAIGFRFPSRYMWILTVKFLLVLGIFAIHAIHVYILGPKITAAASRLDPAATELPKDATRLSKGSAIVSMLGILLGLIVVWLGLILSRA